MDRGKEQNHYTSCLNVHIFKSNYLALALNVSINRQSSLKGNMWSQTSSSSTFVLSSNARISAIVMPYHWSVQQNTWRWKFVNILRSPCQQTRRPLQHYSEKQLKLPNGIMNTSKIPLWCIKQHNAI